MKRRDLLLSFAAVPALFSGRSLKYFSRFERGSFAIDANRIRFFVPHLKERFSIMFIADTHLFRDDARGADFVQYSARMSKAYNQTKHFQTGEITHPEECFQKTLALAQTDGVSLVALIGDIVSFPSEAAIDWVGQQLKTVNLPYVYVAGNHDWHYEGMPGTLAELRNTWAHKRLSPLYQGANPLMTSREINGVRFVALDNSTYEISPEQLAFFEKEVATEKPIVLMIHIPLYAPERPVSFGCGHPEWGAKADRSHELERRPRWPETGHTTTTMRFYKEVTHSPNVIGVLAGHTHKQTLDVINGLPQIITPANATGGYLKVEFVPV
ncbi:MAG: metallophosphoesterase family protein [Runella zeae]